jgi:hypothetical protein
MQPEVRWRIGSPASHDILGETMSRYYIPADSAQYTVVVGFDNPLQTFFAMVTDTEKEQNDEDDCIVLWEGCNPYEITDVDILEEKVKSYIKHLPAYVKTSLKQEYEARTEPSELQKRAIKIFTERV